MAANLGHKAKPLLGERVRMMKRKGLETGLQTLKAFSERWCVDMCVLCSKEPQKTTKSESITRYKIFDLILATICDNAALHLLPIVGA